VRIKGAKERAANTVVAAGIAAILFLTVIGLGNAYSYGKGASVIFMVISIAATATALLCAYFTGHAVGLRDSIRMMKMFNHDEEE
jgi:hypothetical protein